ncbi:GIY-YIG nuclease family protein [Thalassovita mediterranea]|nr:GIY-YIG nuclease family protein [Thalassovita mediterranea]
MFCVCSSTRSSWVYIVTNKRNGTLYTGVTSDLVGRVWQHRHGYFAGFSRKYGCTQLVWFETHDDIKEAIAREKRIKRWKRAWKLELIETGNPDWRDLYSELTEWVPDRPSRFIAPM